MHVHKYEYLHIFKYECLHFRECIYTVRGINLCIQ